MTHPPIRHSEFNFGVEDAADALITEEFLQNFADAQVSKFSFKEPEKIDKANYWEEVASELLDFKKLINQNIKPDQVQVVLGGDNTVTLSSLQAIIERVGDALKVGYVQFDSHGEMHQSKTSISKNFHGMYMRPFFDEFDITEINRLVPSKMKTSQILAIGDIVFDGENTEEEQFYKNNKIRNIRREEYLDNEGDILKEIKEFLSEFEYIHINFDIDVFDSSVSAATGLPEDGRWFREEIFSILDLIHQQKNLSIDLVEINPKKEGSEKTIKLAQEILFKILN